MSALPFPIPPPPVIPPGSWDPTREAPGRLPGESPGRASDGPTLGEVWKRIKESVGVKPEAKVEPRVEAQPADCSQARNQNECNACKLTQGSLVVQPYTIPNSQHRSYAYQLRIANHLAGPEQFAIVAGGTVTERALAKLQREKYTIYVSEWMHGGIRFDGFWRGPCTAVEAKAYYRQFFNSDGELQFWAAFDPKTETIEESWIRQFNSHHAHVTTLGPPARLEWHFLESGAAHGQCRLAGHHRSVAVVATGRSPAVPRLSTGHRFSGVPGHWSGRRHPWRRRCRATGQRMARGASGRIVNESHKK